MRLAALGGSFNPPHIGHLCLAEDARLTLGYDRILFVPAFVSPFKESASGASAEDRLQMVHLACGGNEHFSVESCELDRGGVSFTWDTIAFLEEKYRSDLDGKIGLILGDDLAPDFALWRRADELAERADIILASRFREDITGGIDFRWPHTALGNSVLPVSSSDVRGRIAAGKSWRYLVPEAVYGYIRDRNLYDYR